MSTSPDDFDNDALSFTERRVIDQLGHLVPQIHLTLVSVLQSIALAFLLASFRGPSSSTLPALWTALLVHHLYLPHIASFFVVIIAWNEYAYATFLLHWPLTALSTTLQFLFTVVEIAAFTNVDTVGTWTVWIGVATLLGAIIHQRNVNITSDDLYPHGSVVKEIVGRNDWIYWALGSLVVAGFLRLYVGPVAFALTVGSEQIVLFDVVIPLVLLAAEFYILHEDNALYVRNVNKVLKQPGSPYTMEKNGRIVRKKPDATDHT